MDNCGCAPGSMLTNQSDNLTGGGFSNNNSNDNNTSVDLNNLLNSNMNSNMNGNSNSNVNSNMNSNGNSNSNSNGNVNINDVINNLNNNNNINKYQTPENSTAFLQNNNNIKTTNEIIESIAKNNIADLNKLNKPEEIGKEVIQTAEETIALSKKHIMLATVFTLALAWNDAIKYYIGRNIKLNKASPFYYLYYALIVTVIAVVMHMLLA